MMSLYTQHINLQVSTVQSADTTPQATLG